MNPEHSHPAIDVHAHFGQHDRNDMSRVDQWHSGDPSVVSRRARTAGIRWTVASALTALLPFRGNIAKGNTEAVAAVEENDNVLFWTVIDPSRPHTIEDAEAHLRHPRCMGIKMHPFQHQYDSRVMAGAVFEVAERNACVILTHSGDHGSYPEDFVPWADTFPSVRLIVAHLGHGDDGLRSRQVRAIEAAKHRNIWTDTSSSASIFSEVVEWAVKEIGDDRILFGTDTPLYSAACHKARIETAEISEESKARILIENARELLGEKLVLLENCGHKN